MPKPALRRTKLIEDVARILSDAFASSSDIGPHQRVADAGYDSESNHSHAREDRQVRTVIPPQVRSSQQQASSRSASTLDACAIQRRCLPPTGPNGNSHLDDQASQRIARTEPLPTTTNAALALDDTHSQRHDSLIVVTFSTEPDRPLFFFSSKPRNPMDSTSHYSRSRRNFHYYNSNNCVARKRAL